MTIRNVTITSKNQITLPSDYVRKLQLTRSRVLQAKLQGNSIVLSLEPSLSEAMQQFWGKHSAKRALTDKELKQAARQTTAKQASKR